MIIGSHITVCDCTHTLCNAHHIRELTRAWEQDGQQWAQELLEEINKEVNDAGGFLNASESEKYRQKYRSILTEAEKESPLPDVSHKKGQKGKIKKNKSQKSPGTSPRLRK